MRLNSAKSNWTPVVVADTTNYTDGGYHALVGGATTQRVSLTQLHIHGLDTSAAGVAVELVVQLDSTIGATLTSLPLGTYSRGATLSAPPVAFSTSTTKPKRLASTTSSYLLTPAINTFGGLFAWACDPGNPIEILGSATVSQSELSLSVVSGASSHISSNMIFEAM